METGRRSRPGPVGISRQPTAAPATVITTTSWPWLPTQNTGTLAAHPYCTSCGQVKAVGSGRALDKGGLVNLLARLKRRLAQEAIQLADVQRRLILKALENAEADDDFGLTRDRQFSLVTGTIAQYTGLRPETVETYLHAC